MLAREEESQDAYSPLCNFYKDLSILYKYASTISQPTKLTRLDVIPQTQ